jgi:phosphoribosylaminoimidazole carboxylase
VSGTIYLNEIAPRPHNSGHYTIEACETSQFENHLRAILSLPLGSTALKVPSAAMLNIVGTSNDLEEMRSFATFALSVPGASVHLYGKGECRKGRKMGHVTVVADSDAEMRARIRMLLEHLPGPKNPQELALYAPPPPARAHSHAHPLVGVIMGSDSDLPVMTPAAQMLDRFGVPYELTIVSAHRTPDRLVQYARSAASRGLKVIIAGAGGAAHLPGMVAAMTALPVIGVPVKGSSLDGIDSLHSIVQMPVCIHCHFMSRYSMSTFSAVSQLPPSRSTTVQTLGFLPSGCLPLRCLTLSVRWRNTSKVSRQRSLVKLRSWRRLAGKTIRSKSRQVIFYSKRFNH